MSEKFNELIELIISEENDQAKELFHEIIVDKSRSIYESLIDEDEVVDEDEEVDESDEDLEESDFDEELGGDAAEDMIDDISADEEGLALEDEHEDEEMEDRVVDLEDALDELKAEFEKLMGDDEGEEEMDMGPEMDMDEPEMDMDPEEEEMDEAEEMDETFVREYTEKAPAAVTSEPSSVNKHSTVASKNDMGGKAASSSGGENSGSKAATAKVHDAGNVNKPGAKVKPVAAPKPKATA